MTILDSNKNVVVVKDAGLESKMQPKPRINGVVPYYAVVPVKIEEKQSDLKFEPDTWSITSPANFRRLCNVLQVPNSYLEEAVERFFPEEPVYDKIKSDIFNGVTFCGLFLCLYQLVYGLQNL